MGLRDVRGEIVRGSGIARDDGGTGRGEGIDRDLRADARRALGGDHRVVDRPGRLLQVGRIHTGRCRDARDQRTPTDVDRGRGAVGILGRDRLVADLGEGDFAPAGGDVTIA